MTRTRGLLISSGGCLLVRISSFFFFFLIGFGFEVCDALFNVLETLSVLLELLVNLGELLETLLVMLALLSVSDFYEERQRANIKDILLLTFAMCL